jgi:hypothetical protein
MATSPTVETTLHSPLAASDVNSHHQRMIWSKALMNSAMYCTEFWSAKPCHRDSSANSLVGILPGLMRDLDKYHGVCITSFTG